MTVNKLVIRCVRSTDSAKITEIYNFYVLNTHHTFETEAVSEPEMRRRIVEISENHPFLIAEKADEILGYAYAARFKQRKAYRFSAEVSVYVKNGANGNGIGRRLYENLFNELEKTDVHMIIAGIALPNEASVRLHERFDFEKTAHFREVGFKFGRWIDIGYWQKTNAAGCA